MSSPAYIAVSLLIISVCGLGCRKKTPQPTVPAHTAQGYGARANTFEGQEVLELDLPDLQKALFDDQAEQDLGITLFAESVTPSDESTRAYFRPLYFEFDRDTLKPGQSGNLEHNIAQAKKLIAQGYTLVIEGHACTSSGSESYNMQLSERRAQHIKNELVRNGIPATSIKCVGRGTSKCLVASGTREQQAPNRRVELVGMKEAA